MWKLVWHQLLKLNMCKTYDPAIILLSMYHIIIFICLPGDMHKNVHKITVFSNKMPETPHITNKKWINML